jgi:hypothetical protein
MLIKCAFVGQKTLIFIEMHGTTTTKNIKLTFEAPPDTCQTVSHHVDTELSNSLLWIYLISWNQISQKTQQQVNVKFLVKLNKTAPKIFNLLSEM